MHFSYLPVFRDIARPLGLPLRGDCDAILIREFYAHDRDGAPDLRRVTPDALERIICRTPRGAVTELMCHPGRVTPELTSSYTTPREYELDALTDPRLRAVIRETHTRLSNFADLTRSQGIDLLEPTAASGPEPLTPTDPPT